MPQPRSILGIADLVDRYAAAARRGDSALIASSFLEDARVRGSIDGAIVDRSATEFLAFIDEGGPSPALEANIIWFDAVGTSASVRVDCRNWHAVHYADFLSLIWRDSAWRIAGKTFFAHERA